MSEEWYSPSVVTAFRPQQVKWVLRHLLSLKIGLYPPECKESGYTGLGSRQIKTHANFIIACEVAAELETRLNRCGLDGLMLWIVYVLDFADRTEAYQMLAGFFRLPVNEIEYRVRMSLYYCCGKQRKVISYGRFCYERKQKGNKKGGDIK